MDSSPLEFQETDEQLKILNCTDQKITINALAGTGKTTTLLLYAQKFSEKKMLYLCYNKSIAEHAQQFFPQNVDTRTFHSLAYRSVGFKYKNKLQSPLTNKEIVKILQIDQSARSGLLSQAILNTLNHFCASANTQVAANDVDQELLKSANIFSGKTEEEQDIIIYKVSKLTQKLWDHITDLNNPSPITHDVYLKLFTLNPPQMKQYDTILIDEAQDLTPCFIDFIQKQTKQVIFVGDKHQAIYGWRGAVNYLEEIGSNTTQLYLTQSFRFSQELANFSNCTLAYLESDVHLKGLAPYTTQILPDSNQAEKNRLLTNKNLKKAFIARHNFSIYEEIVRYSQEGIPFYVEGGLNYTELKELKDLYQFKRTGISKNPLYEGYKNFEEIQDHINKGILNNIEITKKVAILNHWGDRFERKFSFLMKYFEEQKTKKLMPGDIIFTSVHKAKGKEYDVVELADDFMCHINHKNKENRDLLLDNPNKRHILKEIYYKNLSKKTEFVYNTLQSSHFVEEMNIFYVALTRAKHNLILPTFYYKALDALNHLLTSGHNEQFLEKSFNNNVFISPQLVALFEKEKIKLALSPVNNLGKAKNKHKI